ncbi:PorP/SprF family type IX secretion system membrane protein [Echinicola shivajiensis]|uniref:PorP/SprF family type IX secretion system membrane protein n=1 Tax=Echinicola shivajiensis TaxID=1035916 RepID=UPI001BFC0944|nr:type IX secretion system membrane protein PorP/SprF [Echinicola shivajiensis]
MKKALLFGIFWMTCLLLQAQDIQYSQFYAAPIYLNPAMTGASEMTRIGMNYRNQWPGLNQSVNSYSAYMDHYMFNINSGIGLMVNKSQQSAANLSTTEIAGSYSYRLQLGAESYLRMGGQVSYMSRDAYFGNLVFGSQLDVNSDQIIGPSGENLGNDIKHRFADYSFGLLYNNKNAWLGISGHHLTTPNTSFLEDQLSELPMKLSAHGGVKVDLLGAGMNTFNDRSITFAFNYKTQGQFQQLDLGTQLDLSPVVLGVWYRGIPVVKQETPNHESLIGLFGFSFDNGIDIGYSYDYTLSKLGNNLSGGAHEISLRFSFFAGDSRLRGRESSMPCFKY